MVSKKKAKLFCKEDISLIENYDKASKDLMETWDLHHRKEEEGYSRKELIDSGMYYGRPASELIFLTHKEHASLHKKGVPKSEEHRKKISEAKKGNKHHLGKKHSEETRRKMSLNHADFKGEKSHCSKQVMQIDKQTGQIIKIWPCVMEVERVLGINPSNISKCCYGKYKSCGGYIWRYAD